VEFQFRASCRVSANTIGTQSWRPATRIDALGMQSAASFDAIFPNVLFYTGASTEFLAERVRVRYVIELVSLWQ